MDASDPDFKAYQDESPNPSRKKRRFEHDEGSFGSPRQQHANDECAQTSRNQHQYTNQSQRHTSKSHIGPSDGNSPALKCPALDPSQAYSTAGSRRQDNLTNRNNPINQPQGTNKVQFPLREALASFLQRQADHEAALMVRQVHHNSNVLDDSRGHSVGNAAFPHHSAHGLQGGNVYASHSEGSGSLFDGYNQQAASLLPQMVVPPSADPILRRFDGGSSVAPLGTTIGIPTRSRAAAHPYAAASGHGDIEVDSASTTAAYTDALQQYYQCLEEEKNRLLASTETNTNALRQANYSEHNPYASLRGDVNDQVAHLQASQYPAQLARETDVATLNAFRQRADGLSAPNVLLNHNQYMPPDFPMAPSHLLPANAAESSIRARDPVLVSRLSIGANASAARLPPPNQVPTKERLTGSALHQQSQQETKPPWQVPSLVTKAGSAPPVPPPLVEGSLPPLSERTTVLPLGIKEDEHWCSKLTAFVRSELLEVFRANGEDVASRINNKRVFYLQIGIRCKFCAHLPRYKRCRRATTFPSSIARIHQAVSMMVREHFPDCKELPDEIKAKLVGLQGESNTPETKSRNKHWPEAAKDLGLVDAKGGIMFHTDTQLPGVGAPGELRYQQLVDENDRGDVPDYLYFLMSQTRRVLLSELDRIQIGGPVQSLPLGTPGFACRHCGHMDIGALMGQRNRFFPPKLRQYPTIANTLHDHLQECLHCPQDIKTCIAFLKSAKSQPTTEADAEKVREFFSRIFVRLHGNVPTGVPIDFTDEEDIQELVGNSESGSNRQDGENEDS